MIVADTSAWIDYFRGVDAPHTAALDYELQHNRIVTGDLIIVEFLQGFRKDKDYQDAKLIMDCLEYFDLAGREIALEASLNLRSLRKIGISVQKPTAVLIATFCIAHNFQLIHNDREYDPMEEFLGLMVRR